MLRYTLEQFFSSIREMICKIHNQPNLMTCIDVFAAQLHATKQPRNYGDSASDATAR